MEKLSRILSKAEQQTLRQALVDAEIQTTGEIVPIIAEASGRYDRAEDIFGLLLGIILMVFGWLLVKDLALVEDGWSTTVEVSLGLGVAVALLIAGIVAGSRIAARVQGIRALFTSSQEMSEEVERRAAECFHRYGVGNTRGATGVLIYISLFEKMVRVEGDHAINEKLQQSDWQAVVDSITAGIRDDSISSGILSGVTEAGKLLRTHFPHAGDDVNPDELVNHIHYIEAL